MKISVVTINYNNRAGLEATAESVACLSLFVFALYKIRALLLKPFS